MMSEGRAAISCGAGSLTSRLLVSARTKPLASGRVVEANTNLLHYRIVSKIGAGGMGEVYLAEGTRLDRKVAIKLLPTDFAADEDRMRRSEQGARATSALNYL